ncbi:asparagine synthase-related protein [Croceicoccus sp. F390]|uniref:asparagine synthase (glutamine-hydrolyzing) n=1 Tax=Croceicoccus esteveae TaxID=3075597 RepID=A0ABU2ZK95_9SPHN|nr:asparagine synthase-related protein [Croceicoccus sp. F390]MDT0577031.1 asparagine synthase-related protein [Croceicoccus sp. F390]
MQARRPSIIPSASEPETLARGTERIGGTVRLDNGRELASTLGLPGNAPVADVLVAGWRAWGHDLAERLRGVFAFALHDPATSEIYLARDVFGVAPLFLARDGGEIVVSHSSRSVRQHCSFSCTMNEAMIADFIKDEVTNKDETFFNEISRLPPGCWLSVTPQGERTERYWSMSAVPRNVEWPDAASRFRELFDQSVARCHVEGDTALLLSGGLDSSAILASLSAQQLLRPRSAVFSMTYRQSAGWGDGRHLDALRDAFDLDVHDLASDGHDPLMDIGDHLAALDGPYLSYGHSVSFRLQKAAAAAGFGHVLSGHGGDEIVSYGVGRLNELARQGRWLALWREARGAALLHHRPRWQSALPYLAHVGRLRKPVQRIGARLLPVADGAGAQQPDLAPALAERVGGGRSWPPAPHRRSDHDDRMLQEWALDAPLQAKALEVFAVTSRAVGVHTAMPFYDRDLVELTLSLPSHHKLRDGQTRAIVRQAMAGRLPPSVLQRADKFDFALAFKQGLLKDQDRLRELTGPANRKLDEFANRKRLDAIWAGVERHGANIGIMDAFMLWRAAVLALWLEMSADNIDRKLTVGQSK